MLHVCASDYDEGPAEQRRCGGLEREPEHETARAPEERSPEPDERQTRGSRHAPKQRLVKRSVRRDPVGERRDECAKEQPDEPRGDIHLAVFRGSAPDPPSARRVGFPPPGDARPSFWGR
jgi:hypothetical protein